MRLRDPPAANFRDKFSEARNKPAEGGVIPIRVRAAAGLAELEDSDSLPEAADRAVYV